MTRKRLRAGFGRALVLAMTGFFWLVWLYLLAPLASLLLWVVGISFFSAEMVDRGGYRALEQEISNYGFVALGIFLAVVSWMAWNKKRYGNRNTRKMQPLYVKTSELAEFSGLQAREIKALQQARQATVGFDDALHLIVHTAPNVIERKTVTSAVSGANTGRSGRVR